LLRSAPDRSRRTPTVPASAHSCWRGHRRHVGPTAQFRPAQPDISRVVVALGHACGGSCPVDGAVCAGNNCRACLDAGQHRACRSLPVATITAVATGKPTPSTVADAAATDCAPHPDSRRGTFGISSGPTNSIARSKTFCARCISGMRNTRHRRVARIGWTFTFAVTAYNWSVCTTLYQSSSETSYEPLPTSMRTLLTNLTFFAVC
jgi:hypothetical protein